MKTATVAMTVSIAIIRDCDYCVQRPLVQPQSESQKRNDCDCEWWLTLMTEIVTAQTTCTLAIVIAIVIESLRSWLRLWLRLHGDFVKTVPKHANLEVVTDDAESTQKRCDNKHSQQLKKQVFSGSKQFVWQKATVKHRRAFLFWRSNIFFFRPKIVSRNFFFWRNDISFFRPKTVSKNFFSGETIYSFFDQKQSQKTSFFWRNFLCCVVFFCWKRIKLIANDSGLLQMRSANDLLMTSKRANDYSWLLQMTNGFANGY